MSTGTGTGSTASSTPPENPLIFYKLITPYWLHDNTDKGFSKDGSAVDETKYKIPSDVKENELIFLIDLLDKNKLKDDDDITVKVKVAVQYPGDQPNYNPPARDPMIFGIFSESNGPYMGIQLNDYTEYTTLGPFRAVDGIASRYSLRNPTFFGERAALAATSGWYRFSEIVEMTFVPNSYKEKGRRTTTFPWASASNSLDSGFYQAFGPFSSGLELSKGLSFGIYRDKKNEMYMIKSFEISIYKNSKDKYGA
jgi:hypothetical protein